jgi:hypothetical protein
VLPTQSALEVTVLYTKIRPTLTALRRAASLARDLGATIRILTVQVVPYPLPMEEPPVDAKTITKPIQTLVDGDAIATRIEICLGRDLLESLLASLAPASIVVIGAKRRWWPAREKRLAKKLRHHGHHVIFVPEAGAHP